MASDSSSSRQWTLPETEGLQSLLLDDHGKSTPLADDEVLVEMHAASLNYRDLMIAKGLAGDVKPFVVPGSDGAGTVKAAGKNVTKFNIGDRVVTHLVSGISSDQLPSFADISVRGLGQSIDGTLCELGHFNESALVHAPKNLSFERAATLTCSGLTAWNAVYGLKGRETRAGDWVLVQGTGGVSIASLQFAVASGANVVATTSSEEKARRLKELGAKHVLNYRSTPAWGSAARDLTPKQRGFDLMVDVGGNSTLNESLKAIRLDGVIAATGILDSAAAEPVTMLSALWNICTVRGVLLGTRDQFEDMVRFVEEKDVQPVVDDETFELRETREAYERLQAQKHFSKVVIKIR